MIYLKTSGLWSYSTCRPAESRHLVADQPNRIKEIGKLLRSNSKSMRGYYSRSKIPNPRSTRNSFFSSGDPGEPSKKFSGFTSPWTYLWRISQVNPVRLQAIVKMREKTKRAIRNKSKENQETNPLECIFSNIDIASIAMQATISTDILKPM